MSAVQSSGSPAARMAPSPSNPSFYHDDQENRGDKPAFTQQGSKHPMTGSDGTTPLSSSKYGNLQSQSETRPSSVHKKSKQDQSSSTGPDGLPPSAMDNLLAKLSEQQAILQKQKAMISSDDDGNQAAGNEESSSSSVPLTPATDAFSATDSQNDKDDEDTIKLKGWDMLLLKKELEAAKDQIARQQQELHQSRVIKHTVDQALSSESDANQQPNMNHSIAQNCQPQTYAGPPRIMGGRNDIWGIHEDARSEASDAMSGTFSTGQNIWSGAPPGLNIGLSAAYGQQFPSPALSWGQSAPRSFSNKTLSPAMQPHMIPQQQRTYTGPSSPSSAGEGRLLNDFTSFQGGGGLRRSNTNNSRNGNVYHQQRNNAYDGFGNNGGGFESLNAMVSPALSPTTAYQPMGFFTSNNGGYQPRPIGTPLSPTAAEFRGDQQVGNPWNTAALSSPGQTYVSPMEPLNYRRLLDRSVSCDWKYIVDKIVFHNDQQASIFLQQKLKVGTAQQKFDIIEAIVAEAYPLMVNRFGNFLVQRCFEHGTPDQVIAIANAIRGNTLSLSMDAFGCHVVQKAFDAVPENYKAIMVHELLRRIPETVVHRYACHVWQKLFELRWSDSPPQIMKYVNEALRGMWNEVALGETGSLVVQNIFENCLEEDKRPCINEVIASIDIVAHGQFGNWCIQHICEHGAPADRSRAIDHVLRYATEYSMDQFASKVVEKCLKIGGPEFLDRYLERVCEGRADRPRIPLIDIASDQYGNYLIQYILTQASANHREIVASHIRKHMVSLRGSKFGSRVGMLCCNPAYATHPGPGVGVPLNRFPSQSSTTRFSGGFR